jgi:hypothetical protein
MGESVGNKNFQKQSDGDSILEIDSTMQSSISKFILYCRNRRAKHAISKINLEIAFGRMKPG